jgi:Hsp70 protein
MRECLGLSVGATNLVAARPDGNAIVRRAEVTWGTTVLTGFVERFGDPVPIVAADGSVHAADRLVVEALTDLTRAMGRPERTCVAVPAHWPGNLVDGMRALLPDAIVTSDAVAALTALRTHPGLPARGIVALCDFGGTGTTITFADASADFRVIGAAVRYDDFSGNLIDRAVLTHLLAGLDVDPSSTSAVASLAAFREQCRIAKQRLSFETATGLPGLQRGSTLRLTRGEVETLTREPMDGMVAAFDDALGRNGVRRCDLAAIATVGGGARMPFVAQRLSQTLRMPVTTTTHAQTAAAIGAALLGGREPETVTRLAAVPRTATALAPVVPPSVRTAAAPAVAALAWSESEEFDELETGPAADDPDWARPELMFQHGGPDDAEALPPLRWYQRPALLFAAAACAAVVSAVGFVVTTDTQPANASSPAPSVSATPSMSDVVAPVAAGPAAPPAVTETVVAPGQPTVARYQAPPAGRAPAPQAPAPAPEAPPPAPETTVPTTTTTVPTTTTPTTTTPTTTSTPTSTTPTTTTLTTTSTSTPTSAPPPPPPPPSSPAAEPGPAVTDEGSASASR